MLEDWDEANEGHLKATAQLLGLLLLLHLSRHKSSHYGQASTGVTLQVTESKK